MSINGLALDTGAESFPSGSLLRFTLMLPDGTPIMGSARVVRSAHRMCGLRYEDVEPAARAKVASFLVSKQGPPTPAQR
jgi:c-di-GMP-binding flagellar brake protein YcgR